MNRLHQALLIATFMPLCWLAMMAAHELGHVAGAVATCGRIERVVLYPLTVSRTDVSPNPSPLFVAWGGPIVGVVLLLTVFVIAKLGKFTWAYLFQFFVGFCLIANGPYIGIGSFGKIGDAGEIIRHGNPIWLLWLFGAACFPLGLYLWNGLGPHFGFGTAAGKVEDRAAYASCGLLILTVILELILSPR